MQRNKGQRHDRPDEPETTIMPCRIHVVSAPATHAQRQAWTCLWRILLSEPIDHHERVARQEEEVEGKETLNL
jgi:hypothetical protein